MVEKVEKPAVIVNPTNYDDMVKKYFRNQTVSSVFQEQQDPATLVSKAKEALRTRSHRSIQDHVTLTGTQLDVQKEPQSSEVKEIRSTVEKEAQDVDKLVAAAIVQHPPLERKTLRGRITQQ